MSNEIIVVTVTLLVLAVAAWTWAMCLRRVGQHAVLRSDSTGQVEVEADPDMSYEVAVDPVRGPYSSSDPYSTMPIPVVPPSPGPVHRPKDPSNDTPRNTARQIHGNNGRDSMNNSTSVVVTRQNVLSTAQLRYELRVAAVADGPGPLRTRPFGLRAAVVVPNPVRPDTRFCDVTQVAVDEQGRPLIETMGKQWATKSNSDGDEGPEEDYGWEEESGS